MNDARIALFGVADLPGFVDFFAGQADVGGGSSVPNGNGGIPAALSANNFAPLLRSIVFVGKAALGEGFDFQRVGLRAKGSSDQIVMGLPRAIVVRAPMIFSFC